MRSLKIISGGQTGVDRAALDVALQLNYPCGGWCPKGRIAEDGVISARYPLKETPSEEYQQRTEWNVRDSDGTLVLTQGAPTSGTKLTIEIAKRLAKPCLVFDPANQNDMQSIIDWLSQHKINTLNIAGPRASLQPEIYSLASNLLQQLLSKI